MWGKEYYCEVRCIACGVGDMILIWWIKWLQLHEVVLMKIKSESNGFRFYK